jgi:iron complex transport system substrate-binding protein
MKTTVLLCIVALVSLVQGQEPFPLTVEHQYGSTTISAAPQRVLALGYTEQDFLLAPDVQPIAVRYWYGDETNAIFPWAQDKVVGENPPVLNMPFGTLNYEAILALKPKRCLATTREDV